jgi:regulator of sigma E protease
METIVIIAQFVLSLTILVFLHELGHFAPSKWFGARVEKFYIFFDAWFSLFKFKKGDTEYGIGWLPLGGYVKIAGMVDESFDREQLKKDPQPWEFRSKPAWQRLIIMLGGVTVNFILGFLLFGLLFWRFGESYVPAAQLKDGIAVDTAGRAMGLQDGDQILFIGDKAFDRFSPQMINLEVGLNEVREITVLREGEKIVVDVPEEATLGLLSNKSKDRPVIEPRYPFVIANIPEGTPAAKAGLLAEDKVIGLNAQPIRFYQEFAREIKDKNGVTLQIKVLRNQTDTLEFAVTTTEEAKIGVQPYSYLHFFETEKQRYNLVEAIPAGVNKGVAFISNQLKAFGQIFTGKTKASESLGGFVSIAKLFPGKWNWEIFWNMTAVLSLVLGFMNLLPIPGLDGGHVFFLFIEMITGKKVSDKIIEKATMVGFILLISLLLYANGLDVMRLFNKG